VVFKKEKKVMNPTPDPLYEQFMNVGPPKVKRNRQTRSLSSLVFDVSKKLTKEEHKAGESPEKTNRLQVADK